MQVYFSSKIVHFGGTNDDRFLEIIFQNTSIPNFLSNFLYKIKALLEAVKIGYVLFAEKFKPLPHK